MKQYLSRQLWMLAILLFAGIGNAFGVKVKTNFDGLPKGCGEVYYLLNSNTYRPESGEEMVFQEGSDMRLNVNIMNPVYSISSIKVNNIPASFTYAGNNAYCDINLTEEEYNVDVEFSLDKDNAKTIKVIWDDSHVNDILFDFPTENLYIHPQGSGIENYLPKSPNVLRIAAKNPFGDQISVMVDNNDVTQDYLDNDGIFFDDVEDHVVTISFVEVDSRNITVSWEENLALVYFSDQNGKRGRAQSGTPFKLPKGSAYKMHVDLGNPFVYNVKSVKVGTVDVTSDYNANGYYEIPGDNNDYNVNVTIAEAESTQNITFNWNSNYNVNVSLADQKGNKQWLGSGGQYQAATGANYQMQIHLGDPTIKIQSVKVNNKEVTVTYNSTDNCYEYEIVNLSSELTVDIEIAEKPANTVTVTWGNDCSGVHFVDENDNWFYPSSGKPETLVTGSTYKMLINLDDVWAYRPLVTIAGGNPVAATFNSNEGRYEYVIENLSQDLVYTISVEERPTWPVTVTWDYSKVKVHFESQLSGDIINVMSGTACYLTDGIPYRMYVNFPYNDFYSLTSITDNNNDVTSNYIDEGYNRGYLEFDAISASHNISIGIKKSVETKTITVDCDKKVGSVQFYDTDDNWFFVDPDDGKCELPIGKTYRMSISSNNSLIYSVGSVTVDQVGIQDYNDYEFSNLSADHRVAVVFNTVPSKTVTVTWDDSNENVEELYFCDESENHRVWTNKGNGTKLPLNATVKLRIETYPGYKVKTLKDGNKDVTANFVDGWYVFENLSDDHILTIEFETVKTQEITVTYNTDHIYSVELNNRRVDNNRASKFNNGSDVTMIIYCEDGFKPVLTIDNGESVTLDKNKYGDYEYVFNNLSADHNVSIAYAQIEYHNITVIFDCMRAQLNTAQYSENYIPSNDPIRFEKGTDVTLVLSNLETGHKITSIIMDDKTDITATYNANGYYKFENLNSDHVVTVNLTDVATHELRVGFDQYSQGTVYLESALTGKEKRNWGIFNAQSDVTMTIEPAIGYEVSSIIIRKYSTDNEEEVINIYNSKGFKYVFENLTSDYDVTITTQKKSMADIDPVAFTLDNVGMCTFCSEYDLDFTDVSGITAYIASGFNPTTGSVALTKVKQAPAGTGLIIKGTPGNYTIPVVETNCYHMNLLTGIVKQTSVPTYGYSEKYNTYCVNYTLQTDGVFYASNDSSDPLTANKAYLQIPVNVIQDATDRPIRIESVLDGDVDGNGVVDIADAVRIVNIVVGKVKP